MTLHPSIIHINAKNLSEQTVKMINKMVEKVNENEKGIYPINGYAPGNYWCNCHECKTDFVGDKLAVTCNRCALEAAYIYLTAENQRLREAEKIALKLAEWSLAYPRSRTYSVSKMSMDDELIAIEEQAKEYFKSNKALNK